MRRLCSALIIVVFLLFVGMTASARPCPPTGCIHIPRPPMIWCFRAPCSLPTDTPAENHAPPDVDDQGIVNNPWINERANSCFSPGQVCTTSEEWVRGWYRIRQQYGVI